MSNYSGQNARLEQTQREVDLVVGVMRSNLDKVLERDAKLSDLDARADDLNAASVQFATSSRKLKKKMWWKNLKWQLAIGGVVLAVLIITVTTLYLKYHDDDPDIIVNGEDITGGDD